MTRAHGHGHVKLDNVSVMVGCTAKPIIEMNYSCIEI